MGQAYSLLNDLVSLVNGDLHDYIEFDHTKMARHVLVTGGATVPFKELLLEAITPHFLTTLKTLNFTKMDIQCGTYVAEMQNKFDEMASHNKDILDGLQINIFGFDDDLKEKMQTLCRGVAEYKPAGVVIGHAGTGTIADAIESEVAMIAVANPNLMDNHQAAFAAEQAAQHANIIQGHLGKLAEAIPEIKGVIEENSLDHLELLEEPNFFPLAEEDRATFIDQVIASGLKQ